KWNFSSATRPAIAEYRRSASRDDAAAEADLRFVDNRVLARCRRPLRRGEFDERAAAPNPAEAARRVFLPVARLRRIDPVRVRVAARDPVCVGDLDRVAQQQRMIVALYDRQLVGLRVLRRDEPGRPVAVGLAADLQPVALPDRVIRDALVLADDL